jgi:hypothetical protein
MLYMRHDVKWRVEERVICTGNSARWRPGGYRLSMEGPGWGYRSEHPNIGYRTQSSGMKPVSEAVCARASSKSVEGEGVLAFTHRGIRQDRHYGFVAIGAVCEWRVE